MGRILKDAVSYSKERISLENINLKNYVTTDNLLQNKQGKVNAVNLPPQGGNVTKFNSSDILIANIRPYLKKIWFAKHGGGSSADVLTFKVKSDYDPEFIYYALFRDEFFEHMMNGAKGTKMPRGDKTQVLDFPIPNFKKQTQQKIAHVLSTLDAKIDLNNRINRELEAMAKLLYDYWFVQFDFPDAEGKPYKSSGGKMVYSEVLKREVPAGWEVKELSDIANITMGQSPSGSSYNDEGLGEIFFQGSTDFGWRFPSIRQYTTEPSRMAKIGDVLLSVRAPVGTLNIADNNCCIGRGLAALNSKKDFNAYLYYVMAYFKQIFDYRNNSGTTFGSITKDDLFSLKLSVPNNSLLEKYESVVSKYNQMILNNHKQTQQLAELRDWLLPMLMNGQVRVEE
jgi:type I restriction enzyme S subunit